MRSDWLVRPTLPETAGQPRLLGCECPYPHVAIRSLRIRTGSGTADIMSVVLVATEVTGDQVALEGYQRRHDESQFGQRNSDRKTGCFRRSPKHRSLVRRSRQSVGLPVFGSKFVPTVSCIELGRSERRKFGLATIRLESPSFCPSGTDSPILFLGYAGLQGLLN